LAPNRNRTSRTTPSQAVGFPPMASVYDMEFSLRNRESSSFGARSMILGGARKRSTKQRLGFTDRTGDRGETRACAPRGAGMRQAGRRYEQSAHRMA
jgi:hypothetical protein